MNPPELMGFASRTSSSRNVKALKDAGWGWLIGPLDHGGQLHDMPHALDNGEWVAFSTGNPWDGPAFKRAVEKHAAGARFIVIPDVVADRDASMSRSLEWLPWLRDHPAAAGSQLLFAVQDGMTFADLEPHIGGRVGIFIGGSTEWKVSSIVPWGLHARAKGIYCHVGRVNTKRRINLCIAGMANSFDGTSPTKFAKTLPMLDGARRQMHLI